MGAGDKTVKGHNDDITALAIAPDMNTIVTGEVGKDPLICLWKADNPSAGPIQSWK